MAWQELNAIETINSFASEEKPQLIFPVTILTYDDKKNIVKKELGSQEELRLAMASCKNKKKKD